MHLVSCNRVIVLFVGTQAGLVMRRASQLVRCYFDPQIVSHRDNEFQWNVCLEYRVGKMFAAPLSWDGS